MIVQVLYRTHRAHYALITCNLKSISQLSGRLNFVLQLAVYQHSEETSSRRGRNVWHQVQVWFSLESKYNVCLPRGQVNSAAYQAEYFTLSRINKRENSSICSNATRGCVWLCFGCVYVVRMSVHLRRTDERLHCHFRLSGASSLSASSYRRSHLIKTPTYLTIWQLSASTFHTLQPNVCVFQHSADKQPDSETWADRHK